MSQAQESTNETTISEDDNNLVDISGDVETTDQGVASESHKRQKKKAYDFFDFVTMLLKNKNHRETFMCLREDIRVKWLNTCRREGIILEFAFVVALLYSGCTTVAPWVFHGLLVGRAALGVRPRSLQKKCMPIIPRGALNSRGREARPQAAGSSPAGRQGASVAGRFCRPRPVCVLGRPMISSGDNSIIAQTTTTTTTTSTGQNVQILSLASNLPPWATLVLGSILLLAIPFCRKHIRLQDVTKNVESATEVVEMVAEATEKVAEELIHVLPNGWLKEAVVELEKIAFFVDKSAEVTESIIDKVEDVVEVLDTTLKPVLNGEQIKLDGDGEGVTEKIGMPTKISATAELKE
ncbi:hypothetical protein KSP40_PGU013737 [Platanthera guangdongensis]|uniref:Uncharacterized protein n=1 Tax=Platanthera guangdongensis TaxID=2320717 RepID=A0ABR2N0Z7_9ASPA